MSTLSFENAYIALRAAEVRSDALHYEAAKAANAAKSGGDAELAASEAASARAYRAWCDYVDAIEVALKA